MRFLKEKLTNDEIHEYSKLGKEIGLKTLGDIRRFKKGYDGSEDASLSKKDSDIEQMRKYRRVLGKDFKLDDTIEESATSLTVKDVKDIAMDNYENGGSFIIETYSDEDIQEWINEGNSKKDLFDLMNKLNDRYEDMKGFMDKPIETSEKEDGYVEPEFDDYYDEKEYSPSNPWDAPGMSIKDFIR